MNRVDRVSLWLFKFGVEATLVCAVVVGVAYGAMRLAQRCDELPIMPGKGDVVTLPAAKANRSLEDQPPLFPTDKEQQTDNYGNEYGRELAKERESRSLGPWTDPQADVSWWFVINTPGVYEVELTLASDESEAGSQYEVKVCGETFSATVPSTGGATSWKAVPVGRVKLSASTHRLAITPCTIKNRSLMNLASATLRLIEPKSRLLTHRFR